MGGRTGAGVAELLPQAADWRPFRPRADLTAGLMVGLVALPLALGFGASSGLGAGAGQVTAIVGPLFFAAAHDFLLELSEVSDVRVVVLRMSRVSTIDATGASVLADTIARLEGRGITVLLSGLHQRHDKVLRELGVFDRLGHDRHLFANTPEAIAHARRHVAREHHTHDGTDGTDPTDPTDSTDRTHEPHHA